MSSPSLDLQAAVVAALRGDPTVAALVRRRVFDAVPDDRQNRGQFPYVSLGPSDETSDDADCVTAFVVSQQIDCWSRQPGFVEVRKIADAVRRVLTAQEVTLADNALVLLTHRITRVFRDPDGLTSHAALTFEAIIEQP